jgi:hypothetical protein
MTFIEADKIFQTWSRWYWPSHFMLHAIFISKIPESFLPYPLAILEEALNIIVEHYQKSGDLQMSQNIQETMIGLSYYVEDKEALQQATELFSKPEMLEGIQAYISQYKVMWQSWLDKQIN